MREIDGKDSKEKTDRKDRIKHRLGEALLTIQLVGGLHQNHLGCHLGTDPASVVEKHVML